MMKNEMPIERDSKRLERNSRTFWILMILGFFAIDLSIAAIAITMAVGILRFARYLVMERERSRGTNDEH